MPEIRARLADGTTLVFAEGTPEAVVDRVVGEHVRVAKAKSIQATKYPSAQEQPADSRSWLGVGVDQLANVGKGALDLIPSMVHAGGDLVEGVQRIGQGRFAEGANKFSDTAAGLVKGFTAPFEGLATSARGLGALIAPETIDAPSRQDWESAAQTGGAMAAGAGLTGDFKGAALDAMPEAMRLQEMANKAKDYRAANPISSDLRGVDVTKPLDAVARVAKVAPQVGAAIADPILSRLAQAKSLREAPPASGPIPGMPGPPEAGDIAFENLRQNNFQPIANQPPARPHNPMDQFANPSGVAPSGPLPNAETVVPRGPLDQFANPSGVAPSGPLPNAETIQPPAPQYPVTPLHPDITRVMDALFTDGVPATSANTTKASMNAPYLLEALPELRGVPPGDGFNARLFNGFQKIGHELNATEASIPRDRPVPTGEAIKKIDALQADAAQTNQNAAVRSLEKVKVLFESNPGAMPWEKFIKAKRAFFDEVKLSSKAGREAYQIFKDISSDVSPELANLNQKYFTAKTAMELADMNPYSGVKLAAEQRARLAAAKKARIK